MHPAIDDKLLKARTDLRFENPFFAVLLGFLGEPIDATDMPDIKTMATDGRNLWVHPKFVESLTRDEVAFVFAHEVMHNALDHHLRRQTRKAGRWNVAGDYVINLELVECGMKHMPKCGLIDKRFAGMGAEEVYRILDDENNGDDSHETQDPGGLGEVRDACAPYDEPEKERLRAEQQARIHQAAMVARTMSQGRMPASMGRLIEKLLQPRVDWRAVLRRFIDESITKDFTWSRPNRRLLAHRVYTPSSIANGVPHIVIAVDTSGSIDHKILQDFGGEINGAFNDGAVDKLTVIYADAAVSSVEEFETGDDLVLRPTGGGGTAFSDTFRTIIRDYPEAKAVIYLTDMYVGDFGEQPPMPVIWGVYGRTNDFASLAPPFGETINISV